MKFTIQNLIVTLILATSISAQNSISFTQLNVWVDSLARDHSFIKNGRLYSVTSDHRIQVHALDSDHNFILEGELNNIDGSHDLLFQDTTLFAVGDTSITKISIADNVNPKVLLNYPIQDNVRSSVLNDSLLIYQLYSGNIKIFNINSCDSLKLLSVFSSNGYPMRSHKNFLYCGINVYDISDPESPIFYSSIPLDSIEDLIIDNDTVYAKKYYYGQMGTSYHEIYVFEVNDTSFNLIKTFFPGEGGVYIFDFRIINDLLFISFPVVNSIYVFNKHDDNWINRLGILTAGYGQIHLEMDKLFLINYSYSNSMTIKIYDYDVITAVNSIEDMIDDYSLHQNYPNPFNPSTIINYSIPKEGNVKIEIFNMLGELINTLVNEYKNVGSHTIEFSNTNLPSGIYFYKLTVGSFTSTKKMMLIK